MVYQPTDDEIAKVKTVLGMAWKDFTDSRYVNGPTSSALTSQHLRRQTKTAEVFLNQMHTQGLSPTEVEITVGERALSYNNGYISLDTTLTATQHTSRPLVYSWKVETESPWRGRCKHDAALSEPDDPRFGATGRSSMRDTWTNADEMKALKIRLKAFKSRLIKFENLSEIMARDLYNQAMRQRKAILDKINLESLVSQTDRSDVEYEVGNLPWKVERADSGNSVTLTFCGRASAVGVTDPLCTEHHQVTVLSLNQACGPQETSDESDLLAGDDEQES